MAFSSDNLPSLGAKDDPILPLALGNTPFVSVVAICLFNAQYRRKPKEVEPLLNYGRCGPISPARSHLTASYASNLRISREVSSQPLVAEWWLALLRSGNPGGEGPHLKISH